MKSSELLALFGVLLRAQGLPEDAIPILVAGLMALFGHSADEDAWRKVEEWGLGLCWRERARVMRAIAHAMRKGERIADPKKFGYDFYYNCWPQVRAIYIVLQMVDGVKRIDWAGWRPCYKFLGDRSYLRQERRFGTRFYYDNRNHSPIHLEVLFGLKEFDVNLYPGDLRDKYGLTEEQGTVLSERLAGHLERMQATTVDARVVIFSLAESLWSYPYPPSEKLATIAGSMLEQLRGDLSRWEADWDKEGTLKERLDSVVEKMRTPRSSFESFEKTGFPGTSAFKLFDPLDAPSDKVSQVKEFQQECLG